MPWRCDLGEGGRCQNCQGAPLPLALCGAVEVLGLRSKGSSPGFRDDPPPEMRAAI